MGMPLVSRTKLCVVLFAVLAWVVCPLVAQAAITVNGVLSDWGISLDSNRHLVYDSAYGYSYNSQTNVEKQGQTTINGQKIIYDLEDSNDNSNSYRVGPLYGGQNYDAEALVVTVSGSDLYIGIATGQRPDNGSTFFAPGDICITKGTKTWGIEVGGASRAASSQVVDGDKGTRYTVDRYGNTTSTAQLSGQSAGSIWDGGTWTLGIDGSGDVKTQLNTGGAYGGTYLGTSDYVYRFDSAFGQHAFIELCIPNYAQLFGTTLDSATIRWAPVCGNDQLNLCVILPGETPNTTPEPASVFIWAALSLAAACIAKRASRSAKSRQSDA
jgi:hypothetical protein